MRVHIIVITSLLLLLPQAMLGQTFPSYESKGWWHLFLHGGTIRTRSDDGKRTGDYYLQVGSDFSLVSFDYVNGFTYGPDLTLGRMLHNKGRLEADVCVEWSAARQTMMHALAARYILPPEWQSSVEVFCSSHTDDLNADPLMDISQKQLASSLFGWNDFKLYSASRWGVKGTTLLHDDVLFGGALWHEERQEMSNHRKRNVFRIRGKSNVPMLRGHVPDSLDLGDTKLWRTDLSLTFKPGSRLYIYDDMHSSWQSLAPTFRLDAKLGWGDDDASGRDAGLRFLSLDLIMQQCISTDGGKQRLGYFASTGFFPIRHWVQVTDMHHFHASHFCWQNHMESSLRWFALLADYELSTSRQWFEAHAEYMRRRNDLFAHYVQLHLVSVAEHRLHAELSYGWQLMKDMRIGLSAGWDGSEFDGLGFNLIFVND